jgi:hypothetical protein
VNGGTELGEPRLPRRLVEHVHVEERLWVDTRGDAPIEERLEAGDLEAELALLGQRDRSPHVDVGVIRIGRAAPTVHGDGAVDRPAAAIRLGGRPVTGAADSREDSERAEPETRGRHRPKLPGHVDPPKHADVPSAWKTGQAAAAERWFRKRGGFSILTLPLLLLPER